MKKIVLTFVLYTFAALAYSQTAALTPSILSGPAPIDTTETSSSPLTQIPTAAVNGAGTVANTAKDLPVFGQWIFSGQFAQESFKGFNPDYLINIGDRILVKLWGAFDSDLALTVDSQGNIFLPKIGPVRVQSIRNEDLNDTVRAHISSVYKDNVGVYASLDTAQPVRIFVSGFVRSPGLYTGFASDSVLHFLDKAGGIDPARGSYHEIKLRRANQVHATIDLYEFILRGQLPSLQLHDGDSIVVESLQNTVSTKGLINSPSIIEFAESETTLSSILKVAGPKPQATHARIVHNTGTERTAEYVALSEASVTTIQPGDEIEIVADRILKSVLVQVEGEHVGRSQFALPYGATIGDLLKKVELGPLSKSESLQLFRISQAARQKEQLQQTLQILQTQILSSRSTTLSEANLRQRESQLLLQFIDKAKSVEPKGQVVIPDGAARNDIVLEDGDRIVIPKSSPLVAVHGEVYFPNVVMYKRNADVSDYIDLAGGYTQRADRAQVILLHQNGEIEQCNQGILSANPTVRAGDEILVLPAVDIKTLEVTSSVVQVLYQLAIGTGVVFRLLGL